MERKIIGILTRMGIIDSHYHGEVILCFSEGGLSDIYRARKSIKRRVQKKSK